MIALFLLIIIYVSFISLGLPDSILGSVWPSMYRGLSVPMSYAGILFMLTAGGTIVSSIFSDRLIKRFGTGKVTAVSVLMTAFALLGFSFSNTFWELCIYTVPLGLGAGSVDTALNNYVANHYKARHMNWLHCFWGIGATTGPIIMSMCLLRFNSWKSGYFTIGIFQCLLAVFLLVSLPLWKSAADSRISASSARGKTLTLVELLSLPGAKHVLLSFFCYCAIEATAGLWGSSYLVMVRHIEPEIAARWIALFYLGITLGRFLSGLLTFRLSNRQMVRIGELLLAAGVIMILLPLGNGTLMAGFFLLGAGCAPIYPSLLHDTPTNFGREHSQSIMGMQMACAYVGSTVMPPLFGMLASIGGYALFPIYIGVLTLLMTIMVEALNRSMQKE